MVRTLDTEVRAFLSNRYRRLDNFDLAEAVLPILAEMGEGIRIVSAELTESRMYIKVINERLELEVKKGDVVQAGIALSNSEVGLGALSVEPLIYRLICTNGMIAKDYSKKRYHVGRNADEGEAYELFTDETLKADDRAFFLGSVLHLLKDNQIEKPNSKRLMNNPITVSCINSDLEKQIVFRAKRLIRVR